MFLQIVCLRVVFVNQQMVLVVIFHHWFFDISRYPTCFRGRIGGSRSSRAMFIVADDVSGQDGCQYEVTDDEEVVDACKKKYPLHGPLCIPYIDRHQSDEVYDSYDTVRKECRAGNTGNLKVD